MIHKSLTTQKISKKKPLDKIKIISIIAEILIIITSSTPRVAII